MDDKTQKFLAEQFKPGEYAQLTILVKLSDMKTFMQHLTKSGLNLAVMPQVEGDLAFAMDDETDGLIN